MRWEQLFDDLEAQFDAFADAELQAELADRQRVAVGAVRLTARLAGALGEYVRIRTVSGVVQAGRLHRVGPDWLLLEPSPGQHLLVNGSRVTVIEGLDRRTGTAPTGVALRLASVTWCGAWRGTGHRSRWSSSVRGPSNSPAPSTGSGRTSPSWRSTRPGNRDGLPPFAPWPPCR